MPLSRIEIRRRATAFAKEWADATDEDAEAKSYRDGFFQVFDMPRKRALDARAAHKGASLADLYDPLTMPPDLVKAHAVLDKAVDKCYRPQPFQSDAKQVEYLFELYEKYTSGLLALEKPKRRIAREKKG